MIKLLGIKNIKEVKTNEIVSKNIKVALATLSKRRSCVEKDARRELLTGVLQKNNCFKLFDGKDYSNIKDNKKNFIKL